MVIVNGQYKVVANTAKTAHCLIRLTALQLLAQAQRGARIVQGKRARLLPRTHLRANHQRKRLHHQSDRSHLELKRVPERAGEASPGERTKSAGLDR